MVIAQGLFIRHLPCIHKISKRLPSIYDQHKIISISLIHLCKSEDSNFTKSGFLRNFQILIGKSGSVLQIEKITTKSGRLACVLFTFIPNKCFSILYIWNYWCFYANSMVYNFANPAHVGTKQYSSFDLLLNMLILSHEHAQFLNYW